MKKIICILFLALTATGCSYEHDQREKCECCEKTYTNIDSALDCAQASGKLLLFAFVSADEAASKATDWRILNDGELIRLAQRDYVLVVANPKTLKLSKKYSTKEFLTIIKSYKGGTSFVVTNRVLYPFREFDLHTDKNEIIDMLNLGDGP